LIEEKYIELINCEIDGENTPEQSAALRKLLEKDPEAARLMQELSSLATLLKQAGKVIPPEELGADILANAKQARKPHRSIIDVLRSLYKPRYAYAFTTGVIIGISLYFVFLRFSGGSWVNVDTLYGTSAIDRAQEKALSTQFIAIKTPAAKGSIKISFLEKDIVAEIRLDAEEPVEMVFRNPNGIDLELFKPRLDAGYVLKTTSSQATISKNGPSDYVIVFKRAGTAKDSIEFRMYSSRGLLFEKTVGVERNPAR